MIKGEHHYGGKYWGIGNKWLFIWFSDYRNNTIVRDIKYQLQIGSKLGFNKVFKIR